MQKILKQSKLDVKICEKIWDVVNPDYNEVFSKQQFFLCMAIIDRVRHGSPVPSELPAALVESAMVAAESLPPMMQKSEPVIHDRNFQKMDKPRKPAKVQHVP